MTTDLYKQKEQKRKLLIGWFMRKKLNHVLMFGRSQKRRTTIHDTVNEVTKKEISSPVNDCSTWHPFSLARKKWTTAGWSNWSLYIGKKRPHITIKFTLEVNRHRRNLGKTNFSMHKRRDSCFRSYPTLRLWICLLFVKK